MSTTIGKSLAVLKKYDDDTVIQLIDSAHKYFLDPTNFPLKRLTVEARAPFSAIYSVLKKSGIKVYQEVNEISLSKVVKAHLLDKILKI